jgi:hypothetical protein
MLRLPHRTRVLAAAGACWLAAGCSLPGPSSAEPVGEPVPVIRVEVVSVERWIVDDLQVAQAPWDTVRLSAALSDLTFEEAANQLPPQFWLAIRPALPDDLRTGTTWTDTIRIWQGDGLNRRSLLLNRGNRVIGDTLLDGRRILVVEEWAGLRNPRALHYELRSWETQVAGHYERHERAVSQQLRARSWLDPAAGIYRARWDTLAAVPEVRSFDRWISPAGDTVEVPARFDAIREFRVIGPPPAAGG